MGDSARRRGLTGSQIVATLLLAGALTAGALFRPALLGDAITLTAAIGFLLAAGWRVVLVCASGLPRPVAPSPPIWPRYTVIAALYDEAAVVGQLIGRLKRIDYPADRLQALVVLEACDHETIAAALACPRPSWMRILIAPPGKPRTKPRALNIALAHATGDLLTVYDAEDDPDPGQLREAAARFAAGPARLACLQAPLRVRVPPPGPDASPFLDHQFAAEYAALFEVVLPGMARLGLPFPLGGTSNHFRVQTLRAVGGWDAWNVTEDADLGFRLWRRGWRSDVLGRPTHEAPPGSLEHWLPQRTRWLKGYMQTWGVQTRDPAALGWRGSLSLLSTLGAGLVSAALHGPSLAWVCASVLVALFAGLPPETPVLALAVLVLGAAAAWLCCAVGARRAGVAWGPVEMLCAPAYWSLLSLAFVHAGARLIARPFAWDKTRHRPDRHAAPPQTLDEAAPERLSAAYAAALEPVA